ncbi:ATP-binding cassette domain-containing protein [Litoribacter populi]|uniref:ATP-binding cassette domain-containing protein n=1 Tax=Litoribacter populi TaxID=2598460 RepID=UPI00117F70DD|nr:ATP-binding cassette domain-containing protein [Litoribacter populi]
MKHILEVDGVMLNFGHKKILQNIYLKCTTGQITGILGLNGCGKSSLLKIIFGEPLTENRSVRIDSKSLLTNKRLPSDMRYLPQHNFIPNHLTVKRVVEDFMVDEKELFSSFPEVEQFFYQKVGHLSGGWKRIFELYLILRSPCKFVLLDEPFSHIMPVHIDTFKELIQEEKANKGILITDHLFEHVMELSDQVYLIKNGRSLPITSLQELDDHGYVRLLHS